MKPLGIALIGAVILIFAYSSYTKIKPQTDNPTPTPTQTSQPKTHRSEVLKFTITVPSQFSIKDEKIRVIISNLEGDMIISRNGTQFDSLEEYIKDFDIKHKTTPSNEQKISVGNFSAVSRVIKYPGSNPSGDKIYLVYTGDAVYQFSTSSESLYPDLDQIAQTFKYTP